MRSVSVSIFVASLFLIFLYLSFEAGYKSGLSKQDDELKTCAEEVSNGCPNVTTYAVMLEKENARLNRVCKNKAQKGDN